jgi:hypothetical protein
MISSDRTDERARRLRFEFAELLKTRIEKSAATISSIYADTALSKYHPQIILCRGILGIQNGTPELENLFENSDLQKGLRLVAVELTIDKSKINLFFVTYDENVNRRTELLGEQFNISSSSGIKWETKLVTSPSQTSRLVFYEPKPEAQIEFLINRIMQCLN